MFDTVINTQTKVSWNLFPGDVQALIEDNNNGEDLVIVDVCSSQEFKDRHLENAININFLARSFKLWIATLDKDETYLVYCKVGGRSKLAQRTMRKLGINKVYNLVGGTLLWEEEGLPFASGGRKHQFVFCPIFISTLVAIKIRKLLKAGCRILGDAMAKVGALGEKVGVQLPLLTKSSSGCCR